MDPCEPKASLVVDALPAPEHGSANAQLLAERLFAARQSTETEVKMSLWEALKLYPMASMWSLLISFAVVMEGAFSFFFLFHFLFESSTMSDVNTDVLGYDIILIGSFCQWSSPCT